MKKEIPALPGVYLFLGKNAEVLYVGKARNLRERVASYFSNSSLLPKTKKLVAKIATIRAVTVESEIESLLLEASFIKKYKPPFNRKLVDGKAYPFIEVTDAEAPCVLIARRKEHKNSVYFGPFPSEKAVRVVLRTARRVFPFQSVRNHPKRRCLYNHLHLCPCPPLLTHKEKSDYRRTTRHLITFLSGNTKRVIADLQKERDRCSKALAFEQARNMQRTIDAIVYVTTPFHRPFEYETNPNLRVDLRARELACLIDELAKHAIKISRLQRIECFDIANFQGKEAVGSMVVAVIGELNTSQYRRFRIKTLRTPDDVAMMKEVLQRRFSHPEWQFPDLIVVDGGVAQVRAAQSVLDRLAIHLPVIGLAKRYEQIVVGKDTVSLPKSNPGLQLLQRLRDEAHRFATTYHKKLRAKFTFA